ncbi:hypothetical protein [Oceanobacillus sp. J11TS1]|uniref:hypothetical protein n=1 Tax=Oceanobacillus sp. J11TS1 TaxID=2807191 RepID=UPI001B2EF88A|nr:hypothetical protein [Oceanobacillus sp. J11TS1]GIO24298.1 hypothetical protein J11TS1_28790 [Oceanobacillus sp. J11TS1]
MENQYFIGCGTLAWINAALAQGKNRTDSIGFYCPFCWGHWQHLFCYLLKREINGA